MVGTGGLVGRRECFFFAKWRMRSGGAARSRAPDPTADYRENYVILGILVR